MTAAPPSFITARSAGPVAAAAALVIAAGAYLLPLPGLSPPATGGPDPRQTATQPVASQPKGPPPGLIAEPKDWAGFAPMFEKLREPVAVAETPGRGPGQDPEEPPTPPPPANPIPWHYRGFIREPSRLVALVELPDGQRLLTVGETVPEHGAHGESIEILRIEPEQLVVRRAGKEENIRKEPSTPDTEAARRTLTPTAPLGRR